MYINSISIYRYTIYYMYIYYILKKKKIFFFFFFFLQSQLLNLNIESKFIKNLKKFFFGFKSKNCQFLKNFGSQKFFGFLKLNFYNKLLIIIYKKFFFQKIDQWIF